MTNAGQWANPSLTQKATAINRNQQPPRMNQFRCVRSPFTDPNGGLPGGSSADLIGGMADEVGKPAVPDRDAVQGFVDLVEGEGVVFEH